MVPAAACRLDVAARWDCVPPRRTGAELRAEGRTFLLGDSGLIKYKGNGRSAKHSDMVACIRHAKLGWVRGSEHTLHPGSSGVMGTSFKSWVDDLDAIIEANKTVMEKCRDGVHRFPKNWRLIVVANLNRNSDDPDFKANQWKGDTFHWNDDMLQHVEDCVMKMAMFRSPVLVCTADPERWGIEEHADGFYCPS